MSVLSLHDHKASSEGSRMLRLRQAIALPIYLIFLILDFASVALGRLTARITARTAGDPWR